MTLPTNSAAGLPADSATDSPVLRTIIEPFRIHSVEPYAGSPSFYIFRDAVRHLFPFEHVIPTHQGRAAERILFTVVGGPGKIIANDTYFDTTRANIECTGAQALDLVIEEGKDPVCEHPFKGDMDVAALHRLLRDRGGDVPLVMVAVTNNSGSGQTGWRTGEAEARPRPGSEPGPLPPRARPAPASRNDPDTASCRMAQWDDETPGRDHHLPYDY